jgi:hypothetical protein
MLTYFGEVVHIVFANTTPKVRTHPSRPWIYPSTSYIEQPSSGPQVTTHFHSVSSVLGCRALGRAVLPDSDEWFEAWDRGRKDPEAQLQLCADVDVRYCKVSMRGEDVRVQIVEAEDDGGEESVMGKERQPRDVGMCVCGCMYDGCIGGVKAWTTMEMGGWVQRTEFGSRRRPRPALWLSKTSGRP